MTDLLTIESRKAVVAKWAQRYGLDSSLVCALIEHESSWNQWAERFEPMFYDRYIQPLVNRNEVKTATEAKSRATSYGYMQVMGQVAREMGFIGRYLTELCDPEVGIDYGCRKLQQCFQKHPDARGALLCFNGGGDPQYPDLVLQFVNKYAQERDA